MEVIVLKSKIHNATVTESSLKYEGSITIDLNFIKKAGLLPYEKVLVSNISRGTRLETYVITGKAGSRVIGLNGAAARLGFTGDRITIMAFTPLPLKKARDIKPKIIILGENNRIVKTL